MNYGNIYKDEKLKQIKTKIALEDLKSDCFLKKIFDIMKKNNFLEIIKYNKKLQERLNLSINDYKKYSQLYSSIEIELEVQYNEYDPFFNFFDGNFINISDEKIGYYHIYFDDSDEEIDRTFLEKYEKVNIITIIIDYHVNSFKNLFFNCRCIKSISFKKFFRSNIYDMSYMFYNCSSLEELDLSNFNTNNVTNMSFMFANCISLTDLELSNFNTNYVKNMNSMFDGCKSLEELDLSNFNTNNVEDMSCMFNGCSSLIKLNLFNFNNKNVTNMDCMFDGCKSLEELNLSNFYANNETDIENMFYGCSDELIKKIKLQNRKKRFSLY